MVGQARLCATELSLRSVHPLSAELERTYLQRAGFHRVLADSVSGAKVVTDSDFTPDDPHALADAALMGAFFAVEQIKATLGVGTPAASPPEPSTGVWPATAPRSEIRTHD